MATLERAPTTSGGATRKEGAAAPAATTTTTTNPRSSAATAASTTTTTASSSEEQHAGPVFAQLRHGHVQVTMGGPARFALATPRQLQLQQQQQLDAEEVVKAMRKAHTVHPLVRAGPNHGGRAKPSGGGGGRHGAVSPAGEDGVPFQQRGMTRQKTLDRLLHLRILEEDGKIVGSGSGSGSGPTPSAQGQQQANKPGLRPSPRNAPPAATAATAATAAVVNASPEPPQPPQLPLPPQPQPPQEQEQQEEEQPLEKQTPTPRNNLYSNSYSSHSHTHKDINPPQPSFSMTRQGSFFNQPSSSSMRRAHDSTNSLAGSNYGSIHRKVNSGSVRGGGGRPPGLDEIQRSSSVIETSYQTTASRWRLSVLGSSVLCLTLYLAVAVGVYGYWLESWGVVRALYFAVVTMTDARLFTIFFALVGISIVALAVGEISARLIEHQNRKVEEFQRLLSKRLLRKKTRTLSRQRVAERPTNAEVEASQHTVASSNSADDDDNPSPKQQPPQQLPLVQTASAASATDLEAGKGGSNGDVAKGGMGRDKSLRDIMSPGSKKKSVNQLGKRRWGEIAQMLVKALLPVIVINAVGAGLIGHMEGWTHIDVVYYAVISSTTIGYGDMHPSKTSTYVVAVLYIPLAVCAVGNAISQIADYYMQKAEEKRRAAVLKRKFVWDDLIALDENGDEEIDIYEFTLFLLKLWGLVDDGILAAINERFQELDRDESGTLTREDFLNEVGVMDNKPISSFGDVFGLLDEEEDDEEEEPCEGLW